MKHSTKKFLSRFLTCLVGALLALILMACSDIVLPDNVQVEVGQKADVVQIDAGAKIASVVLDRDTSDITVLQSGKLLTQAQYESVDLTLAPENYAIAKGTLKFNRSLTDVEFKELEFFVFDGDVDGYDYYVTSDRDALVYVLWGRQNIPVEFEVEIGSYEEEIIVSMGSNGDVHNVATIFADIGPGSTNYIQRQVLVKGFSTSDWGKVISLTAFVKDVGVIDCVPPVRPTKGATALIAPEFSFIPGDGELLTSCLVPAEKEINLDFYASKEPGVSGYVASGTFEPGVEQITVLAVPCVEYYDTTFISGPPICPGAVGIPQPPVVRPSEHMYSMSLVLDVDVHYLVDVLHSFFSRTHDREEIASLSLEGMEELLGVEGIPMVDMVTMMVVLYQEPPIVLPTPQSFPKE